MPSMPDHRQPEVDLTEAEIDSKIAARKAKEKRAWITTVGGVLGGVGGLTFAFVALLKFENTMLSVVGFVVMGIAFGLVSPDQLMKMMPSFKSDK